MRESFIIIIIFFSFNRYISLHLSQFLMISNANFQFFALFILLVILANNHKTLANTIYRRNGYAPHPLLYVDDQSRFQLDRDNLSHEFMDNEQPASNLWSVIFHPNHIPAMPGTSVRRGVSSSMSFNKRKIPLELQKALYAHGIVGRRR
ncbi:unnamed protein product [Rotaria magnacalcarata]|uniref:Uncharacterized protein n=3 Tax=Rotaria magnacalcarata TaxID=392030 RepID=A0A816XG68_9BILA|nr:unnamed protein product [Rotaria magnacalcarata]CAF2163168.1 unnamed protein product [Rotaria magnacalcarata]